MKTIKTSLVLLSSVFVLAACGQNNSAGSTAQTTQAEQPTTTQQLKPIINHQKINRLITNKVMQTLTNKVTAPFQKMVKLFIKE